MTTPSSDEERAEKAGLGPQTHCYVHPERRSVAVCAVCRRGVCRLCHEVVRGRDFCEQDAELLQSREPRIPKSKLRKAVDPSVLSQMTCYNHHNRKAVGICSICRRGVCSSCQVVFKGRSFCKSDAEILLRREDRGERRRTSSIPVTLAAGIAFLDGTAGSILGFILIVIGLIGPEAKTFYYFSSQLQVFFTSFASVTPFPPSQVLEIGLVAFMLGIVDVMMGTLLLRKSRIGAIFSIIVSIMWGFLVGSYFIVQAAAGTLTYVGVVLAIAKIMLIAVGWNSLEES